MQMLLAISISLPLLFVPLVTGCCSLHLNKALEGIDSHHRCDDSNTYNAFRVSENALPRSKKDPFPEVITFPKTEKDISTIVKTAARFNLTVCPRSGGHSYEGYASCDGGMLVDLRYLTTTMKFPDPKNKAVVEIGAGSILGNIYAFLKPHGRVLPAGTCPTVGIGGHTLGGGYGFLARKYGFNADRLIGARVVLSNGTIVNCNKDENADLFWGLRGGGGGNFGIVSVFTFNTAPLPKKVVKVAATWDFYSKGTRVMKAFVENFKSHQRSEDFTVRVQIQNKQIMIIGVILNHSKEEVREIFQTAFKHIPTNSLYVGYSEYLKAAIDGHKYSGFEHDVPSSTNFKRLTSAVFEHVGEDLIESIHREWMKDSPSDSIRFLQLDPFGGAINHLQKNETAFPYRSNSDYMMQVFTIFKTKDLIQREDEFVNRIKKAAEPYSIGNYINYIDAKDSVASYYGSNYETLQGIKEKYDSRNMFTFAQAI
eukprot:Pgem_evm1s10454